ncbi:hypothetical protein JTE90_003252 [Oedothorax gibbosus]|uniref:Uncharacterized protein n=1 Tax=Oedothorax gibbosus TaxID=931172 RepID=A0AAV6V417_9ARAC|nr:hypothetical protein JTE90_003252 [Oedothorax gibbosus]
MASGYSKNPKSTGSSSNPRSQRMQELRQRFEAPSNRRTDSQRDESRQGYQRQRPTTRSRDRDQASGSGQQGPGPSSQVQAMRQKFDLSQKQAESQKEESRRGSHRQGLFAEGGQESRGPVQAMRQKYEALSDKSTRSQEDGSGGDRSRERSQGPGPSHTKKRSYLDIPEDRDRPSFSKALASTPQRGPSGGATGGMQDQFRSAQGDYYEMWYHDNIETVKNYDLLNHEVLSILSQYIPGINAEEIVSSEVLVRMLRDYIKELHEKKRKVTREIENIQEQIDAPGRSGFSSGNQRPNLNETYDILPGGRRTPSRRSHLSQEENPSRAEPFRPVQDLNRRWGPENFDRRPEASGGLEQSHRQSPHRHSQSHSSQMQSPREQPERPLQDLNRRWGPNDFMQQLQPPVQDFNRRWNLEDQFARMQAENEPQNPSFRGPSQQEYNADPEEAWDAGCY